MSVAGGVEYVVVLGCMRWAWKRCTHGGSDDSASWALATKDEFEPVPRICNLILSVYKTDTEHPQLSSSLDPKCLIKRVTYEQTLGRTPPYIIYLDHEHKEIVLAIRGLNLIKESDYKMLLDNRLGMQKFDDGYVHHGLLKSALWLLNEERHIEGSLGEQWEGIHYGVCRTFFGDDFLPRTPTPLEDIFESIFCLPYLLFMVCLRDTFIPEGRKLRDPRRLYAPGRMYHIVERKFCRCGRFPPEVRSAIPVEGRFEHIVLSCNATSDHAIIWITRESEKALQTMMENSSETITTPPKVQKLESLQTLEKEHQDAMERAVSLNIRHTDTESITEAEPQEDKEAESSHGKHEGEQASETKTQSSSYARKKWDELLNEVLEKDELHQMAAKKDANAPR
ncbi:hypothetical protein GH714_032967 [Hevea brasiliensis]|uniref:Mono-/di-acylglycerol lipase N-terminal domain-containing protein n=1 Tax=Hevea brasiliensis TaxID=3981 RepID=A0A6A6L5V1_HEVBR|nr:hypothetical protein GH714_032967 [Hevea brasiliensis]